MNWVQQYERAKSELLIENTIGPRVQEFAKEFVDEYIGKHAHMDYRSVAAAGGGCALGIAGIMGAPLASFAALIISVIVLWHSFKRSYFREREISSLHNAIDIAIGKESSAAEPVDLAAIIGNFPINHLTKEDIRSIVCDRLTRLYSEGKEGDERQKLTNMIGVFIMKCA
jgi:hypothetical protein